MSSIKTAVVVVFSLFAACSDPAPDPCAASPCQHGGTCLDNQGEFACLCPLGYTGAACDVDIDDCSPDPCFNGGTCADGLHSFSCSCLPGTWGVQCEAAIEALAITTPAGLRTVPVGRAFTTPIARTGGSSSAVWSVKPGGTNSAWLSVDRASGVLSGTPTAAQLGPVSVTLRVEEAHYPANFAERTFAFTVIPLPAPAYDSSFEGVCPDGWTLTGDWQCGVPMNVGPATAATGTQCLGTRIAALYDDLQTWSGTTATSPDIVLSADLPTVLTFQMWVDTEGGTYDGFDLELSDDGGATYAPITTVMPAYPLVVAGRPAWGGHQAGLGWQAVRADLSAFLGRTVRLRFGFQSDSSGTFPGVYLDDVHVDY